MKVTPRKIFASWWFIAIVVIIIVIMIFVIFQDLAKNTAGAQIPAANSKTLLWVNNGPTPTQQQNPANTFTPYQAPQNNNTSNAQPGIDPATGFPYADEVNPVTGNMAGQGYSAGQ